MHALSVVSLLICTIGLYAFGALGLQDIRNLRRPSCARGADRSSSSGCDRVGLAIMVVSFSWFLVSLVITLVSMNPELVQWPWQIARLGLTYLYPPLIMQVFLAEGRQQGRLKHPAWGRFVHGAYLVTVLFGAVSFLHIFKVLDTGLPVGGMIGLFIGGMFAITAIYSVLVLSRSKKKVESADERSWRNWMFGLFGLMAIVTTFMVLTSLRIVPFPELMNVVGTSLPLMFTFVGTYYDDRFTFFDLFVKHGLFLLLCIGLLTLFFGAVVVPLEEVELTWARPWVYTVLILPLVISLPWLYRRVGLLLDRRWLGRRFAAVDAVKLFLAGLHNATSEAELVRQAEQGLSAIFAAPVRIDLGLSEACSGAFDRALEIPIPGPDGRRGVLVLGRRANHAPYFSEDRTLLRSLVEVLSSMLENVRLQERKQEQERQTRELSLEASRSELKALRAQINPHFLFNALNAIAGLIHKDPLRADNTVEQLAEVFRYTLRGSDKEWALLEHEMDFVRAYLAVEHARFGERLQVSIEIDPEVRSAAIPTMIVQTLVENAIKHGVAAVRGAGRIEIVAGLQDGSLAVRVADNGPGFTPPGADSTPPSTAGYGLRNVRERLRGHFGERGSLETVRDERRGMTVVTIRLPLTRDAIPDSLGAA